jgi:hypothetical protein
MARPPQLEVRNAREVRQAFRRLDDDTKKQLQKELRAVAGPVAATARGLLAPVSQFSAEGIRPRSSTGIAFVTQTRRRTTGEHPEFAGLIMQQALLPALEQHEGEIVRGIQQVFDGIAGRFNG